MLTKSLGNRFVTLRLNSKFLPGALSVGDKKVTQLELLKANYYPGRSKAGALSLKGVCEGRDVKVFGVKNLNHVNLIRFVGEALSDTEICLPHIIAADTRYIVEEWIEGKSGNHIPAKQRESQVKRFLTLVDDLDLKDIPDVNHSFDYFMDYLVPRLIPWLGFHLINEILDEWKSFYETNYDNLRNKISHPDLSADNMIFSNKTYVIDNELIGYGKGWLLDFYNSNISAVDDRVYSAIEQNVLTRSIYIREIGTALDKGAFKSVIVLADEYAKKYL